jgi:hypothetical protein
VGVGCLGVAGLAYALTADVEFSAKASPNKAGKPTGLKVKIVSKDTANNNPKRPPIMEKIEIRLNKGGQYNSTKFPQCSAQPLVLGSNVEACPGGTELLPWFEDPTGSVRPRCTKTCIGTGRGVGHAGELAPNVNAKLAIFNGSNKRILVYVYPDTGPTFVTPGTVKKKKQGKFDYLLTFTIPPIKTITGAPDASVGTVDTNTPKKTKKQNGKTIGLIVAPKKCSRKWAAQGKFYFRGNDPPPKTVDYSSSCKK